MLFRSVYHTVYMSFFVKTTIKGGDTVLIHSGSGGVGQAAIQVALAYGLEVFTTVSTDDKKKMLMQKFPKLKSENIGNSRDVSFEQMVMVNTEGKGVNHVLNSLSGELLQALLRCVGIKGTFIEIGRFDIQNQSNISLEYFSKQIRYEVLMMDEMESSDELLKVTTDMIHTF